MGQSQMLLLVGAIITFSLFNLMIMKQTIFNMETRCEFEVASDMYRVSYKANEYHDSVGTYIGYTTPMWLENTPFGSIALDITEDEILINGSVFTNDKLINGVVTPIGYYIE